MARIVATFEPSPEEREHVTKAFPDVGWLVDGAELDGAEVLLTFWPEMELRAAGLSWDAMPKLRFVQLLTAGANHLRWNAVPRGVAVAAAPGSTAEPIAEYVLGAMLNWTRGFQRFTQEIASGTFTANAGVKPLAGLRVGLVGFGGIGQAVARILAPFGCHIDVVTRSGQGPPENVTSIRTLDALDELLAGSDVVILCLPLVRETMGLLDAKRFALMREDSLIVNVSRGAVVDEDALFDWLQASPTHAAHIDVWWQYPKGPGHPYTRPFHELPNIVMTPHNSPNIPGYRLLMTEVACNQAQAWIDGKAIPLLDREAHILPVNGDDRGA